MKNVAGHFLTYKYLLIGKFFDWPERWYMRYQTIPDAEESTHLHLLESYDAHKDQQYSGHVGLYETKNGQRVVAKILSYRFKNLKYQQTIHEVSCMRFLEKLSLTQNQSYIRFPRLLNFSDTGRRIVVAREFFDGKPLDESTREQIFTALKRCINGLQQITVRSDKTLLMKKLPRRTPQLLYWMFMPYLLKASAKNIRFVFSYIKLAYWFYRLNGAASHDVVFAHRDLHSQNIIMIDDIPAIIDFEVAALAEPETDLAIVIRHYAKTLGLDLTLRLIYESTKNRLEIKNFLRLTIFYTIQVLSLEPKHLPFYQNGQEYVKLLNAIFIGRLLKL